MSAIGNFKSTTPRKPSRALIPLILDAISKRLSDRWDLQALIDGNRISCNSLDSTLRTALASFYVSDTEGIRLGGF
jgi:hypothetical protein